VIAKSLRKCSSAISMSVAIGIVGCGGPYDATVTGTVKLDGVAVPRGTVTSSPVQGGPGAYGRIEENGKYTIRTGREVGLPTGEYQVTVAANEPSTAEQTASGGPPPLGKPITPLWYRSKDTSGQRYTIQGGENRFDLELSSTPPAGWNSRRGR
jgi:hypothetical protein